MKVRLVSILVATLIRLFGPELDNTLGQLPSAAVGDKLKYDQVKVSFHIPRRIYKLGESIPLKVEFYNRGESPVLLTKYIAGLNIEGAPSLVPVSVEVSVYDGAGRQSTKKLTAYSTPVRPDIGSGDVAAFLEWWVLLEPMQFYGETLTIAPHNFGSLGKPGKYRFRVKLTAHGGYPPSITEQLGNHNPVLPHTPYDIWTGKVSWDSGWVEIRRVAQP